MGEAEEEGAGGTIGEDMDMDIMGGRGGGGGGGGEETGEGLLSQGGIAEGGRGLVVEAGGGGGRTVPKLSRRNDESNEGAGMVEGGGVC